MDRHVEEVSLELVADAAKPTDKVFRLVLETDQGTKSFALDGIQVGDILADAFLFSMPDGSQIAAVGGAPFMALLFKEPNEQGSQT